jgi:hypothetical protein
MDSLINDSKTIDKLYLDNEFDTLYGQNISSFIYTRYGYLAQICDKLNIKLDYNHYTHFIDSNSDIIKYKIDCFSDYTILLKSDAMSNLSDLQPSFGNILCIGQNNIFNISDLMPCQIYYMRIHFNSFASFFDDIKFNPDSTVICTDEYISNLKEKIKNVLEFIFSKLNYSNTYETIQHTLKQVKNHFQYDDMIYSNSKIPYFLIDSKEEEQYWLNVVKKYLNYIENISTGIEKIIYAKDLYNFIHKYIHLTIKYRKFLLVVYSKIKELFDNIYCQIYINIIIIQKSESNTDLRNQAYYDIKMCVSALNSIQRVYMLIKDCEQTKIVYKLELL